MKVYNLILKSSNEVISKYTGYTYEEACQYFSKIKRLSIKDLLKIYNVTN